MKGSASICNVSIGSTPLKWVSCDLLQDFPQSDVIHRVLCRAARPQEKPHNSTTQRRNLTDVRRDEGEGAEVGLPHVLRQRVGVLLEVSQQRRRAALRVLDHLPVEPRVRRQDGAAHAHQILRGNSQSRV